MKFSVYIKLFTIKCFVQISSSGNRHGPENIIRIVGGHDAKPNSHPYVVSLQLRVLFYRVPYCAGAIIHERFVLSAAHCSMDTWLLSWLPIDAVAGVHSVKTYTPNAQVITILECITHPLYKGELGPRDIALYKTTIAFNFTKEVQPIKLSSFYKSSRGPLKLVGWGALHSNMFITEMPKYLQEATVTYIPFKDCSKAIKNLNTSYTANTLDEDSNICTGPLSGGVSACVGDSGGPLIQVIKNSPTTVDSENKNAENSDPSSIEGSKSASVGDNESNGQILRYASDSKVELVGIISWGVFPCGLKGGPTVHTNVSTFIDFINYNINML